MKKRLQVVISGRVQGVNFRWETRAKAQSLGLVGWVKNRPDRKVEAVFEGEEASLEEMLGWCHHGPRVSFVTGVNANYYNATSEFEEFEIAY